MKSPARFRQISKQSLHYFAFAVCSLTPEVPTPRRKCSSPKGGATVFPSKGHTKKKTTLSTFFGFHLKGRKLLGKLCDIYGNLPFPLLTFSPSMWPSKLQLAILDTLFEVTFSETVVGATFLARLFSIPRSEGGMRVPHQHGLVQHLVRGVGAELHDLLVRDPHQAVPLPLRLHRCKTVRCSEHSAAPFLSDPSPIIVYPCH